MQTRSLLPLLFASFTVVSAVACSAPEDEPTSESASALDNKITNICSAWEDPGRKASRIVITEERSAGSEERSAGSEERSARCFIEKINVFTGRVDVREGVDCNTKCTAEAVREAVKAAAVAAERR